MQSSALGDCLRVRHAFIDRVPQHVGKRLLRQRLSILAGQTFRRNDLQHFCGPILPSTDEFKRTRNE